VFRRERRILRHRGLIALASTLWTSCAFIPAIAPDHPVVAEPAAGAVAALPEATLDNDSIIG
jgi:hypothetical protein